MAQAKDPGCSKCKTLEAWRPRRLTVLGKAGVVREIHGRVRCRIRGRHTWGALPCSVSRGVPDRGRINCGARRSANVNLRSWTACRRPLGSARRLGGTTWHSAPALGLGRVGSIPDSVWQLCSRRCLENSSRNWSRIPQSTRRSLGRASRDRGHPRNTTKPCKWRIRLGPILRRTSGEPQHKRVCSGATRQTRWLRAGLSVPTMPDFPRDAARTARAVGARAPSTAASTAAVLEPRLLRRLRCHAASASRRRW